MSVRDLGLMIDGKYLMTLPAYPLASIGVPTLVLHGTNDKIISFASGERTATAIPGARLVMVNHGSHFACLLGQRELSDKVHEFLGTATTNVRIDPSRADDLQMSTARQGFKLPVCRQLVRKTRRHQALLAQQR